MNGRVVVGLSTSGTRLPMVLWAAAEAAARGAELHLVTAVPRHTDMDRYLAPDPADILPVEARQRLARAAEEAASRQPGLSVSVATAGGPPPDVLLDAAASAELLVVGADDQSPFAEAVIGSVPGALLTTSPCPLAVVPRTEQTVDRDAPVLVALDESGTSPAALAYGFAAADRARRPLRVLRCLPNRRDDAAHTETRRTLLSFGALHPYVEVTEETAPGDPRNVLVAHSRRAALVVLGSRGHGRLASTLFGSVSRDLIRRSGCPVVVIRPRPAHHEALASS